VTCALSLLALAGCSNMIDPPEFAAATIEVDPTIVRTIHYAAANGRAPEPETEVTTKRVEEIECLRSAPGCWLSDAIQASVLNIGTRALAMPRDLHEFDVLAPGGAWLRIDPGPRAGPATDPLVIVPGATVSVPIDVGNMRPGMYRLRVALAFKSRVYIPLPDEAITSQPFYFQPLPDYRPSSAPE
jgi:hypothetical protein